MLAELFFPLLSSLYPLSLVSLCATINLPFTTSVCFLCSSSFLNTDILTCGVKLPNSVVIQRRLAAAWDACLAITRDFLSPSRDTSTLVDNPGHRQYEEQPFGAVSPCIPLRPHLCLLARTKLQFPTQAEFPRQLLPSSGTWPSCRTAALAVF